MARRDDGTTHLGKALGAVLKRVDPDEHLRVYRIWSFWAEEVGELIARRARPTYVRNGVLVVTVATHAWMQELRFMKESLRQRLNTRLGAELIHDLHFVPGPIDTEPADPAPPPDVVPRGRGSFAGVADLTSPPHSRGSDAWAAHRAARRDAVIRAAQNSTTPSASLSVL
jgi:hypothetical protein